MGLVAACVYLFVLIAFRPFCFYKDIVAATSGNGNKGGHVKLAEAELGRSLHRFPYNKVSQPNTDTELPSVIPLYKIADLVIQLSSYQSVFEALAATTILGIADDFGDLRWRHKFFIPAIASFPLLLNYAIDYGVTFVVVPKFLDAYMPNQSPLIDLSYLYYVYMAALSIFTPNSINILAGINGIEVGQSLVIASLLIINSSLYLFPFSGNPVLGSGIAEHPHPATDLHLLSLYLLLPLVGVSLALYSQNRFPARVFVGDTYCYFAGMVFACVAILAHFSKTLLLLLIPQIFNFVYSVPQLFHIIPCPRHRLPKFNARTGLLEPSVTIWPKERPPTKIFTAVFTILAKLKLLKITIDKETNRISTTSNLTILNLWLVWFGPMREDTLARGVLSMQMACGLLGLFVRHTMALWIFGIDNRGSGIV